jgi:uncharacterized protein (DUF1015 family)
MATIKPFAAWRPPRELAPKLVSVPYDVVNTAEARELAKGNPWSLLHVKRSEIDLPPETNPYSDIVYQRAKEAFQEFLDRGYLVQDTIASLFIYAQSWRGRTQYGVVGCASVDDYDKDIIKKHEKTRQEKEDDRTRHIMTLRAQLGPVFLTYRDHFRINQVVEGIALTSAEVDFNAPDAVRHQVWKAGEKETQDLVAAFREVPYLYVADGHHRSASASRSREQERRTNPQYTPSAAVNYFLAVHFPSSQLKILPYNRVVNGLRGRSTAEFITAVETNFKITKQPCREPARAGTFGMYLAGAWYQLEVLPRARSTEGAVEQLDVSILQKHVLQPLLGVDDPRTARNINFVGGIRGPEELEKLVDSGTYEVAFSLYPVTVDELMAIADAGAVMPPKSTWFEPKLRSGLLVHRF